MYANKPEMAKEWQAHTPKDKKLPEKVASVMWAAFMDELEKLAAPPITGYLKSLSALPRAHPLREATTVMGRLNPAEKEQLVSIFRAAAKPKKPVPGSEIMAAIQRAKGAPGTAIRV